MASLLPVPHAVETAQEGARSADERADNATVLDGARVLVVEDEPLTAALIASEIEAASGLPVGPAASVAEALRRIEQGGFEAAIVDIGLLDGVAIPVALELIDRGVPFVIVSASARSTPREILERDPTVPVFQKPVQPAVPVQSLAGEIRHARERGASAGSGR